MFGGDPKRLKLMGGDYVRRSSRRVKVRGEREFIVNSDMMLRDFMFQASNIDDHLRMVCSVITDGNWIRLRLSIVRRSDRVRGENLILDTWIHQEFCLQKRERKAFKSRRVLM